VHLKGLAPNTDTARIAPGGFSLKRHFENEQTLKTIREGSWDVVVLQEQSQTPVSFQQDFFQYGRKLDAVIRQSGAETVLLMTWERPDSLQFGVTTEKLSQAYSALGKELGATVAAAGLAFSRALQERPSLRLNALDGHPTPTGTYLAACVVYTAVFHQSPAGNPYSAGLDEEESCFLRRMAAQANPD
jgi:hypothetical protein